MAKGTVEFEGVSVIEERDQAIRVAGVESVPLWVPKSVIHDDSEVWKAGTEGTLVIYEWWAVKKGLV